MKAHNLRLVFLSGTPMKNGPFEIGKIFNLLRGRINTYSLTLSNKDKSKLDLSKVEQLLKDNFLIDQVILKAKDKMVKINRTTFGFITSSDNKGLIKSPSNIGTDEEFLEKIKEYLDKHNIKIDDTKKEVNTLFLMMIKNL